MIVQFVNDEQLINGLEWWISEARLLEANIHFDNKMSKIENLHQSQTFYIKKKAKLFSIFLVFWLDFIEINVYVILSHDRYSSAPCF